MRHLQLAPIPIPLVTTTLRAVHALVGCIDSFVRNSKLETRFLVVSSLCVLLAMLGLGKWISAQIERGVIHGTAAGASLFSDSLIEPYIQELKYGPVLSDDNKRKLDRLLLPHVTGRSFVSFKIWHGDMIVYSSRPELIGLRFPPSDARKRAMSGQVAATYGKLSGSDHLAEVSLRLPILEVHAPVRETGTKKIIALAETYEVAETLRDDIHGAMIWSWLVVGAATLGMIGFQLGIVLNGSHTIESQRQALRDKIAALNNLLVENENLRAQSLVANQRVTEVNERFLRKIGADLHDGPVQLLGLTQLRLGCLREIVSRIAPKADRDVVRLAEEDMRVAMEAVSDSLDEIRGISMGLGPPEIERLDLSDALRMAARRHQQRSRTAVTCEIDTLPDNISLALKCCLYRVAQEGLSNAFRHAGGKGQALRVRMDGGVIELRVLDSGPGMVASNGYDGIGGQGLLLLRDRVVSLGGTFEVKKRRDGGTCLKASIPVKSTATPLDAFKSGRGVEIAT